MVYLLKKIEQRCLSGERYKTIFNMHRIEKSTADLMIMT